jgi:hypothetical protein
MNHHLTRQQLTTYYDRYKTTELLFTKEITEAVGLLDDQVYLKCLDKHWRCALYSLSFQGVKVVARNANAGLTQTLQDAHNFGKLLLCFTDERRNTIKISVTSRSAGYSPYRNSEDMIFLSLRFTHRPPDDLIALMSRIMEAHVNFSLPCQKEKRIPVTDDNVRKLSLASRYINASIQGVSRQCILQELAFSSARITTAGIAKFLENREIVLPLEFEGPQKCYFLKGRLTDAQSIESDKGFASATICFDEAAVPIGYKMWASDCFLQASMNKLEICLECLLSSEQQEQRQCRLFLTA